MTANDRPLTPPGIEFFGKNRGTQPLDVILAHLNEYVAWSADGKHIVASGPTWDDVEERLTALGVDGSQVVFEFISDPDIGYM